MKTRNILWLYGLVLLPACAAAQSTYCDCAQVADDLKKKKLYTETKAQQVIDTYCRLFARPAKIYPKPYACNELVFSRICETNGQKYIFYQESFLDGLEAQSTWGDQFVLAHEIAHHLLGHTERAYRLGKTQGVPENYVNNTMYQAKDKRGNKKEYAISIPQRHLHELEADALGLWMVIQKKATRSDMQTIFRALPKLLSVYSRSYDPNTTTDSHPSLFIRERLIERYWDKYEKRIGGKRYAAIDEEGNFKALTDDTEEFYAFQLLSATAEQQEQFNETERSVRDSLSRRSRLFVDVVLGGMFQRPALHRAGNPVAATNSRSITGGLRVGFGRWYQHHRVETDLKLAASSFTTQAQVADGLRTIEEFKTTYLYVQPRYVYSRMDHQAKYAYRASGWMATAGVSVSVPLQYEYTNYAAAVYQKVPQRVGVTGVAGLGYGISNWNNRHGHFRVWLLYQPQPLNVATNPSEQVKAWLHTVSLDFSARFW